MHTSDDHVGARIRASKLTEWVSLAKLLGVLAATAVLLWFLFPRPAADLQPGQTEISLWAPPQVVPALRDAIDEFERRQHGRVRVVTGSVGLRDAVGDPQRFLCGVAGGVPPDVIYFDRFAIVEWAARSAWTPLDPFIDADTATLAQMKQRLADLEASGSADKVAALRDAIDDFESVMIRPDLFYKPTWDEPRYQRPGIDDSPKVFGIANSCDNRALYYNEDLLVAAGYVDDAGRPVPPRTWEQMLLKRVDVRDASLKGSRLTLPTTDLVAAGVVAGDQIAIDPAGGAVLARVTQVVDDHTLELRSLGRRLSDGDALWIKIFDGKSYAIRLSQWDDAGRMTVCGFAPDSSMNAAYTNSYYYMFAWEAGGQFLSGDGRRCTFDAGPNVYALQWLVDVFDALGGYKSIKAFTSGSFVEEQDPFFTGKLALRIDLNWLLNRIAFFRKNLHFGVVPAPMPEHELLPRSRGGAGREPITWMGGWAYSIPRSVPEEHKPAAWELIKWLSSRQAGLMMMSIDRDIAVSQGRMFIPALSPRIDLTREALRMYVDDEPSVPQRFKDAYRVFVDLLPTSLYRPVTPVGQFLWQEHIRAFERAVTHDTPPERSLDIAQKTTQAELNRVLTPPSGGRVNWVVFVWIYVALVVVGACALYVTHRLRSPTRGYFRRQWYAGLACASPWIVGFLLFTGGPIFFSAIMSFTNFDIINDAHWVGAGNYHEAFTSALTAKSMGNTVFMAIGVPLSLVLGLGIAMLLDCGVRGLATYRTVYYLPAIVPVVAASVLWMWVFNPNTGLLNAFLDASGLTTVFETIAGWLGVRLDLPIKWLNDQDWSKPSLILMMLWGAGGGMLIWLAGLKNVPRHLYEAAAIDGAGPWQRFVNVTLPMISPYIFFNLIMGIIGTFQIFAQAYIMTAGGPADSTLFYAYHLFNEAFRYLRMGYASALAWILFAIIMALTLINLKLSKKWVHYEAT